MTEGTTMHAEREAIVRWLERWIDETLGADVNPQYVIDAITRGDHLKESTHE